MGTAKITQLLKKMLFFWFFFNYQAQAAGYSEVTGMLQIDEKSCPSVTLSQLKVVATQESVLGYLQAQATLMDNDGRFSVVLSRSYDYIFQVVANGYQTFEVSGETRYDPRYPDKQPVLTASCIPIVKN